MDDFRSDATAGTSRTRGVSARFCTRQASRSGFSACRVTTHAIRAQRGPFRNMSLGGRHLHHSTPGIIGQITLGYLWTWQVAMGMDPKHRAASRAATLIAGLATALTLDEFALWFDLADDYWDQRRSQEHRRGRALRGRVGDAARPAAGWSTNAGRALRDAGREARRI